MTEAACLTGASRIQDNPIHLDMPKWRNWQTH